MQSPKWSCCKRRATRLSEKPVLMIRATSSRSTRPNHMSNQIDSPKAPRLADFRRVPGEVHSVAKQAPFRIAFRVDFGGPNPPKIGEISSFRALRFTSVFRAANLMIFGGSQGWKSLILLSKNKVFHKISFLQMGGFSVDFGHQKCSKIHQN